MENIMRRTLKHSNQNDTSQLYNSDISVVKKLSIAETNNMRKSSFIKKEEEGLIPKKKKASPSPTESENRSMQKLFRRKGCVGSPDVDSMNSK